MRISTPLGVHQVLEYPRRLALGKLAGIKVYPHPHATIGRPDERLHDGPIG